MSSPSLSPSSAAPGAEALDSTPRPDPLQRVVALVKKLFDVPVVLVSRIVNDRLHFLATTGFSVRDADIDYLPCSRVVQEAKPLLVEDAAAMPDWTDRYARGIGFYAGVPILDRAGQAIGALSLIDVRGRHVEEPAIGVLEECAALIYDLIHTEMPPPPPEPAPSAALLIDLFHDAPTPVFVTDADNAMLAVNEAAARLLSIPRSQLAGRPFDAALPEDLRAGEAALYADLFAGVREHYQMDSRLVDGSGAIHRARMTVSLVRNDEGEPAYAIRILEETGRRHEAVEELRLRDSAIAGMPLGLAIVDATTPAMPIIFCNKAFETLTGYRQVEILGSNMLLLRGTLTEREAVEAIEALVAREEQGQVEATFCRRDGRPLRSGVTLIPVWGEADTLTHYVWLLDDRTEMHQVREQHAALRTELVRSTTRLRQAAELITVAYGLQPIEEEAQTLLKSLYDEVKYLEAKVTLFDQASGVGLPVVANVAGNPIQIDRVDPDFGHTRGDVCRIRMQMEQTGEQGTWCLDVPIMTEEGMRGLLTLYAHPGRLFDDAAATAARQAAGRLAGALSATLSANPARTAPVTTPAPERVALLPEA
ncbi:MAG: PAS domain-containing protein [Rhodothermales bacterium]